jgi:hypothetical protein
MNKQAWFKTHWRRVLVDMHIPDWDPRFLAKVRPEDYVAKMESADVTAAMVYTNSHVGLCLYPTQAGKMHRGLHGKDFFGRTLELCHQRGISVTAYHSLIFNNQAHIDHPDWRIRAVRNDLLPSGRYGTCCPNSPYRDFALAQTKEVCGGYDPESIFFDMTFWPGGVCYCPHCIRRYREETGEEPPRTVDWCDPAWVRFQRAREAWMDEFGRVITDQVRKVNPRMTVTHQFSTVLIAWGMGVPFSLADHCDYLSGDFYGEAIQQSIVCKVFFSLSRQRPFEFHTSRCLDLTDHVTTKSAARLETQALLAPAHSSAFMFIDAIDPAGTLNPGTYARIRSIFDKMAPYEPELGGDLAADVAVYFSEESKFDPADNGKPVAEVNASGNMPHWNALLGACRALQEHHIPFTVVTKRNLADLSKFQVLILPDVLMMDKREADAVRKFVRQGGSLYASYRTAVRRTDGTAGDNFMLADVFGADLREEQFPGLTFFTPKTPEFKTWISPQDHIIHSGGQLAVSTKATVLATRTPPWTDPARGQIFGDTFASIHSNPPGPAGTAPAIVVNTFGKGKSVYAAGALEAVNHDVNKHVFTNLVRMLMSKPPWVRAKTHPAIEVVLIHQSDRQRLVASFLKTDPALVELDIPVTMALRAPKGKTPKRLIRLPDKTAIPTAVRNGYAEANLCATETLTMVALDYE